VSLLYKGYIVGQGTVKPINAKVESIVNYPTPTNRKELLRFLGMSGYYRRFCKNYSSIAFPLTNLLSKKVKYVWSAHADEVLKKLKQILVSAPILSTLILTYHSNCM